MVPFRSAPTSALMGPAAAAQVAAPLMRQDGLENLAHSPIETTGAVGTWAFMGASREFPRSPAHRGLPVCSDAALAARCPPRTPFVQEKLYLL